MDSWPTAIGRHRCERICEHQVMTPADMAMIVRKAYDARGDGTYQAQIWRLLLHIADKYPQDTLAVIIRRQMSSDLGANLGKSAT